VRRAGVRQRKRYEVCVDAGELSSEARLRGYQYNERKPLRHGFAVPPPLKGRLFL